MISADVNRGGLTAWSHHHSPGPEATGGTAGGGSTPHILGRAEGEAGTQGRELGRKTQDPAQEGLDAVILSSRPEDPCVRTQETRERVQAGAAGGLGLSPVRHHAGMTYTSQCPSPDLGVLIHRVGASGGDLTGRMLAGCQAQGPHEALQQVLSCR